MKTTLKNLGGQSFQLKVSSRGKVASWGKMRLFPKNRICQRTFCSILIFFIFLPTPLFTLAEQPDYQHGISLLHELKYPPDFEHFEYANPNAPKGGELKLATNSYIQNFAGVPGTGTPSAQGLGRTVDRLLIRTADELSGLYGQLLSGIALSEDKRSLYLQIHKNARWHDGVPITTGDVKFSYEDLLTRVFGKAYLESWIKSMEILNDKELVLHHRDIFTNSNLVALTWFPIRPAHYYADKEPGAPTLTPPVGSGPYRVVEFDNGFVRYERVKDYWGRDIPVNRGRYNFDFIQYDVYRDATVAREALRKGLFDIYFETDIRHWKSSYDIPAVERGLLIKETRSLKKFIGQQTAIVWNLDQKQLQDVRVREALTLAFDFEWQNRVFHHNTQSRANSYFANSAFASTELPNGSELVILENYRDQVPKRVFKEPFLLPVSNGSGVNRSALKRAKDLLVDAGWQIKDGRLINFEGRPFLLELTTQDPAMRRILLPYIESLKILGIDAKLRLLDSIAWTNFLRQRKFDGYIRTHDFLNPPLGELGSYFGSKTANMELGGNIAGIRDPIIDLLIQNTEATTSIESAITNTRALDRVLLWGFYHLPLNGVDEERFIFWNKFGRPQQETVGKYEYLIGSAIRLIDSWWIVPI